MFEDDQLARGHLTPRGGPVMFEHRIQRLEEKFEIFLRKISALGKFGGDESVGAIEPVGHDMFAAHGAVVGAFVAVVAGLPIGLFLLIRGRHAGDGDLHGNDGLNGLGEGHLHWAAHLPAIDARAHDGAESAGHRKNYCT